MGGRGKVHPLEVWTMTDRSEYLRGPARRTEQPTLPDPVVRQQAIDQCRAAIEVGKQRIKERERK